MGNEISSIYQKKSRLHATISTVVHVEVVCTLKILTISIFLSQSCNRNNSDGSKSHSKVMRIKEITINIFQTSTPTFSSLYVSALCCNKPVAH